MAKVFQFISLSVLPPSLSDLLRVVVWEPNLSSSLCLLPLGIFCYRGVVAALARSFSISSRRDKINLRPNVLR